MNSVTFWNEIYVANRSIGVTLFQTTSNEKMSKVIIFSSVLEKGLDVRYLLLRKEEYQSVFEWWKATKINPNQIGLIRERYASPQPKINPIFDRQSNIIEKEFDLPSNETFALVYDNTYSTLNSKNIQTKIEIHPKPESIGNLSLVSELNIHPKINSVSSKLFHDGHYSQAIFEAVKILELEIKTKSGIRDKIGVELVNEAFKKDHEKIKIVDGDSIEQKDEREGFRFLYMGAFQGIKNPKSHSIQNLDDSGKALEYIAFLSLLMKRLDESII